MQTFSKIRITTINSHPTHAPNHNDPLDISHFKTFLAEFVHISRKVGFLPPKQLRCDHRSTSFMLFTFCGFYSIQVHVRGVDNPPPHPACQPRRKTTDFFNHIHTNHSKRDGRQLRLTTNDHIRVGGWIHAPRPGWRIWWWRDDLFNSEWGRKEGGINACSRWLDLYLLLLRLEMHLEPK